MSPDGKTIVWAPMGVVPLYSSNNGSSWTASTGASTTIVDPDGVSYDHLPILYMFICIILLAMYYPLVADFNFDVMIDI